MSPCQEREVTRKRLLISRLRMAVVTMHRNVRRDAVILPGDKRLEDETVIPPRSIDEMMEVRV